jgi:hypothetical protein
MRRIMLVCLLALPLCAGCSRSERKAAGGANAPMQPQMEAMEFAKKRAAPNEESLVAQQDKQPQPAKGEQPEKKIEKARKIRYTAEMKLVVDRLSEAEAELDKAREDAKGFYEKAEINNSSNVVRRGLWRVRVPVENLQSFRKAVARIGDVELDTIESEDMTAKYYDLETHLVNRRAEQTAVREFLVEIGKKDPRYLEVKRELDAISDDINRKEGQLKLWANLTDLTTFTINMREKQPYVPAAKVEDKEVPTFGTRASATWTNSLDGFVSFLEWIAIIAIAVTPWLPIPLLLGGGLVLIVRRLLRPKPEPVIVLVEAEGKKG